MEHCAFGLAKKKNNSFWWLLAVTSAWRRRSLTTSTEKVFPMREVLAGDGIPHFSHKEVPLPSNVTGDLL